MVGYAQHWRAANMPTYGIRGSATALINVTSITALLRKNLENLDYFTFDCVQAYIVEDNI